MTRGIHREIDRSLSNRRIVRSLDAISIVGGGPPGFVGPLDALPTMPASAWGCQRLFAAYNGPILRLIRSSDNAELDWSAMPNGEIDITAILAWSAGGAGFSDVVKMYSQIAGGSDLEQTSPPLRPNFSGGGVVNNINGKPAPQYFPGGQQRRLEVVNWFDPTNMETMGVVTCLASGAARILSLSNDFNQDDYNSPQRMVYYGETYPGTRKTGAYYNGTNVGVSPGVNMDSNPFAFKVGKDVAGWAQNKDGEAQVYQAVGLGALANPISMSVGCGRAGAGTGMEGHFPTLLLWHGASLPVMADYNAVFRPYAQARFGTP